MRRSDADVDGVLVVDKPVGPTSHDVVARVRRALGTRRVGHAGTLDPAASGVLVVLVGEATKLSPYLTAHDKVYVATVALGRATNTWDGAGEVIASAPIPDLVAHELAELAAHGVNAACEATVPLLHAALTGERQRTAQVPPVFSAIKRGGHAAYALARRGETVQLQPRPVEVRAVELLGVGHLDHALELRLRVGKGYYVRAFAHDLGVGLGVPAHLSALRRTSSGPFTIEEACAAWDDRSTAGAHLQPVARAVKRAMAFGILTAPGAIKAGHGQPLGDHDFLEVPLGSPAAWLDAHGRMVAVGATSAGVHRALRGFAQPTSSDVT